MSVGSRRGGGVGGGAEAGAAAVRGAVTGWSAADWLSQRGELAAEIARVRERDANGHAAHAMVAAIAIFMQPIANAPANIGFAMLVAMGLLRVHRLWRVWALMFREPFWMLLVAWAAWTGITLAWSEDFDYGFRQWTAFRAILWVPLIWPVIDRWRWLVGALLAGVACANVIQISQMVWKWPPVRFPRQLGAGLHHPSYMGTWCAVAFALWTMIAVTARPLAAVAAALMGIAASIGMMVSGTRGAVLGAMFEISVVSCMLLVLGQLDVRRVLTRLVLGTAVVIATWFAVGDFVAIKLREIEARYARDAAKALSQSSPSSASHDNAGRSAAQSREPELMEAVYSDPRVIIWRFALTQWPDAPVTGIGYGSNMARSAATIEQNPELGVAERRGLSNGHPHSMWIQALAETGLIGAGLAIGAAVAVASAAIAAVSRRPVAGATALEPRESWYAPGLAGGCVAFAVAAQFDGYQMNSMALGIGAITSALIVGLVLSRSGSGLTTR